MARDIYAPPTANLASNLEIGPDLAPRTRRLIASMLDSLVALVAIVPAMYFSGGIDQIIEGAPPTVAYSLALGAVGVIWFVLVNGRLLASKGQTLGKWILGIKIVDLAGNVPSVRHHLIARYLVYFLPGQIPRGGIFLSTANILWIFGKQRRCLHDHVAGTRVVVAGRTR
jgi:uncharacterized RDD family membrane protein YckC